MKIYAGLPLLLIASLAVLGQAGSTTETPPQKGQPETKELSKIARSNPTKTFAEAFLDPNVVIGVFECPKDISVSGLPTDEALEFLDGYWTAQEKFGVRMLRQVGVIKGDVPLAAVFVCDRLAPDQARGLRIPSFVPVADSKWILALEKTTQKSRVARFGAEINNYHFLEDRTLFRLFHYGHGALCLQWPQDDQSSGHGPGRATMVPQTTVQDLADIRRVLPIACKDQLTVDDAAAIGLAWRDMKTPIGKSVLGEILGSTPTK